MECGVSGGKEEKGGGARRFQGRAWPPEKGNRRLGMGGAPHKGILGPDDAEWEGPSAPRRCPVGKEVYDFIRVGASCQGEKGRSTLPSRKNLLERCSNCRSPGSLTQSSVEP